MVSSTPRPHFAPGKDTLPILQEAGWAPGPVWTGGKSRPHRDSIPDRPARSQSLYRLSYPAHCTIYVVEPKILHCLVHVLQSNIQMNILQSHIWFSAPSLWSLSRLYGAGAPYKRPTQRLSRPPSIHKLGAENHMLQLNI